MAMAGEIILMPPESPIPSGFATCEGQTVYGSQYPVLQDVIGNSFGGDPTQNTIVLPTLPPLPDGSVFLISLDGQYPFLP